MRQRTFLFFVLLIFASGLYAQEGIKADSLQVMDYSSPKDYVIADVTVSGIEFIQKEVLISISGLKAGNTLYVSAPFGSFYGTAKPAVFIASGTGLAPFVSMLRSGLNKDKMLIHGGRTLDSFYFEKEISDILGDENYIRCCSREKGANVYEGRLTKYLEEQNELPAERKYYICGQAEMVVETRDLLIDKGIPYENIIAEIYF